MFSTLRMIGEKLGNYTIQEIVGSGSMGTVYKAEDPGGRAVALKLVRSQVLYSMEKRERFLQCLLTASEIHHRGVCPILEIGDDNDDFFVIMPFINGKTLEQYLEGKPIPCSRALDIALPLSSALHAIHKAGSAHRGLKPANIWILNSSEPSVLLSDCGIARFTEISSKPWKSRSAGMDFADTLIPLSALAYMSPEQVRGDPVDYRTDIFSFGIILYEMLAGRHPFEARTSLSRISAILESEPAPLPVKNTRIPPEMQGIIQRSLAKKREDRYQSIAELMNDIEAARQKAPDERRLVPPRAGIRRWLPFLFCK